jgi:UDP-N-acetylglucosamine/UDP-N-acetylgalactosamine diphosphorylase
VTASLIGDVPKGVMLNQPPIFLGGQGGLVGPCRLAYGITVAAGTIVRKDELRTGRILYGAALKDGNLSYKPGRYRNEKRVVLNNIIYIANLIALGQWYHQVRRQFISECFPETLLAGLEEKLQRAISERVNRLEAFCDKIHISLEMETQKSSERGRSSLAHKQKQELVDRWPRLQDLLNQSRDATGAARDRDSFLEKVQKGIRKTGLDYISVIQGLPASDGVIGTRWLQGIVARVIDDALCLIPSFK